MSNPKISVIVPVYNVETYLEDALDSIVNQTFLEEIEVLMIDDGSTDSSRYIIEKYALDYENFYAFHKENEGLSVTRNYGLNYAKGEYVYFMDSDDYLIHDALEKMYQIASMYDNDVVTANFFRYNENKPWAHVISDYVFNSLEENLYNVTLNDYSNLIWDMPVWNKLYKKEFLDENNLNFYDGRVIFEDNIFSTEVYIKAKSVSVLKDGVYCWRMGAPNTSISQSHDINRGEELYKMAAMVKNLLDDHIESKEILSKKYLKWLTLDIPFYMSRIKSYSKDEHIYIFEGANKLVNLIPDEFFNDLNNYYKVFYKMLKNKDWDDLSEFISKDLEKNPDIPLNIDEKYIEMFDFEEDAENGKLKSNALKITSDNENIKINFQNNIPFLQKIKNNKLKFIIKNPKVSDIVIFKEFFKKNQLVFPIDFLNMGENLIMVQYGNNSKQQSLMETDLHKTLIFEDYFIDVSRDKRGFLRLNKKRRSNIDFLIENIEFSGDKFLFTGHSSVKFEKILLKDYFNFNTFEYPITYNKDHFCIEINYEDFLKAPLKNWELDLIEDYNKISVSKSFKQLNKSYDIRIKNSKNKVKIKFKPYTPVEKINELNAKVKTLKKKNKSLNKKNKRLKSKSNINIKFSDKTKTFLKKIVKKIKS